MLRKVGKVINVLIILVVSGISVYAAVPGAELNGNISEWLKDQGTNVNKVDKVLNETIEQNDLLNIYHQQLAQVKNPSYGTLLPLLKNLAGYNKQFSTVKDDAKLRELAFRISLPVKAGWNTYRKVGIQEIFNEYLPVEQGDKQVALLEYNVKSFLIPRDQIFNKQLLEEMPLAKKFLKDFNDFSAKMNAAKKYDGKEIIKEFVPVIQSYNDMVKTVPASAALVQSSVFRVPIACGWGRAQSIEEFRDNLGIIWLAGGDAAQYRNVENLQETYKGLSKKDAAVFADFVERYYHWAGR